MTLPELLEKDKRILTVIREVLQSRKDGERVGILTEHLERIEQILNTWV